MTDQGGQTKLEQVICRAVELARKLDDIHGTVAELHAQMDEATSLFVGEDVPREIRDHVLRAVDDVSTGLEKLSGAFDNLSAAVGYYRIMKGG